MSSYKDLVAQELKKLKLNDIVKSSNDSKELDIDVQFKGGSVDETIDIDNLMDWYNKTKNWSKNFDAKAAGEALSRLKDPSLDVMLDAIGFSLPKFEADEKTKAHKELLSVRQTIFKGLDIGGSVGIDGNLDQVLSQVIQNTNDFILGISNSNNVLLQDIDSWVDYMKENPVEIFCCFLYYLLSLWLNESKADIDLKINLAVNLLKLLMELLESLFALLNDLSHKDFDIFLLLKKALAFSLNLSLDSILDMIMNTLIAGIQAIEDQVDNQEALYNCLQLRMIFDALEKYIRSIFNKKMNVNINTTIFLEGFIDLSFNIKYDWILRVLKFLIDLLKILLSIVGICKDHPDENYQNIKKLLQDAYNDRNNPKSPFWGDTIESPDFITRVPTSTLLLNLMYEFEKVNKKIDQELFPYLPETNDSNSSIDMKGKIRGFINNNMDEIKVYYYNEECPNCMDSNFIMKMLVNLYKRDNV